MQEYPNEQEEEGVSTASWLGTFNLQDRLAVHTYSTFGVEILAEGHTNSFFSYSLIHFLIIVILLGTASNVITRLYLELLAMGEDDVV